MAKKNFLHRQVRVELRNFIIYPGMIFLGIAIVDIVMHRYHDETSRRSWQNPEKILAQIGLVQGMVVVDIGCGEGFFALPAARMAGRQGKIIGIDINAEAVTYMLEKARREEIYNLEGMVGSGEETVACEECADIVFFGIDLHDFSDPVKVLSRARIMVKKSGKLIDLDWKKAPSPFGPPEQIRFDESYAVHLIEEGRFFCGKHRRCATLVLPHNSNAVLMMRFFWLSLIKGRQTSAMQNSCSTVCRSVADHLQIHGRDGHHTGHRVLLFWSSHSSYQAW